jgi:hypothetical protein
MFSKSKAPEKRSRFSMRAKIGIIQRKLEEMGDRKIVNNFTGARMFPICLGKETIKETSVI